MSDRLRSCIAFLLIYVALIAAHFWLLRLPYFWDEAGYYIPAAHDLFATGSLIPFSTLTNAHPPLPAIYLAIWWKLFAFTPLITRLAMLAVAAFALMQVFLLAKLVAAREVAVAATICIAMYPVFFAQSSLAHADLPAMALTLLGLRLYLDEQWWKCGVAFVLASLSKETAILTPVVLALWTIGEATYVKREMKWQRVAWLMLSLLPLSGWYAYHYARTGFVFGNPEFLRYNVATTLSPLRFLFALWQRSWQVFGHMNMWVLTAMTAAAMLLPPLTYASPVSSQPRAAVPPKQESIVDGRDSQPYGDGTRERIAISTQLLFAALILAHIVAYSLIGGALLSRYLLPVAPLVVLIGVSTLWRRISEWKWLVGFVCIVFVVGWFVNPPYRFAPEDNLNYAEFIRLHQDAIGFVQRNRGLQTVLTAWPASDELRQPILGYVDKPPVRVVTIENFSFEQLTSAQRQPAYDAVLAFSTKYEPQGRFLHWAWWEKQNVRFFDYHRDLPPETIARMLGGRVVMQEEKNGQWVAVIEVEGTRNAELR